MPRSTLTFSSAAAARAAPELGEEEEEPGEVIESAPPLQVGEEREISAAGLRKRLLRPGRGWETPVLGDEVTVHYVGTLLDGTKFASTRNTGEPITFKLGHGEMVSGLRDGVVTMKKGELALFTLPPALGYGDVGAPGIPPGAYLQLEVELVSWLPVVDICKDGGIIKKILSSGGEMQASDLDEVTVTYKVKLIDGSVVGESSEGGVKFHVNEGHLCSAIPKIIKTMKRGEKAVVSVQPQYAFGDEGRDGDGKFLSILPNATLIIDIELVSLRPVLDITGDMKVLKKVLRTGEGVRGPNVGEAVHIRYTAMLENGTVFEKVGYDGELHEFVVDEEQVIDGLDRAVTTMLKNEVSQLTVKPEYGYGNEEVKCDLAVVPPCSNLIYEVQMVDFTKEKESWQMSDLEKIDAAEKMKRAGNDLYKIGKIRRAARRYDKAISYVDDDGAFEGGHEKQVKALRVSCWLNHAACSLKSNDFQKVIKLCSKVLDIESQNVKALYRRAQAYMETADLDLARLDLKKALEADPHSREVKSLQASLKQLQIASNKRDAKLYANMFDRMKKDAGAALKRLKVEKVNDDDKDAAEVQTMDMDNSVANDYEKLDQKNKEDIGAQSMIT